MIERVLCWVAVSLCLSGVVVQAGLPSCPACSYDCGSQLSPSSSRLAPNLSLGYEFMDSEPFVGARDYVRSALATFALNRPVTLSEGASGGRIYFETDEAVWEALGMNVLTDHAGTQRLDNDNDGYWDGFVMWFNFTSEHNAVTPWSGPCAAVQLSLRYAAVHEGGHVFGLEDVSGTCVTCSAMTDYYLGVCYAGPGELDVCKLNDLYQDNPVATTSDIQFDGKTVTWNTTEETGTSYYLIEGCTAPNGPAATDLK